MSNSPSPGRWRWLTTSSIGSSMFSNLPVGQLHPASGTAAGSGAGPPGEIPSLAMCQVSIARPPLGARHPDERQRRVERVDVDVERHELVSDRGRPPAASAHSTANSSVSRPSSQGVPGMLPTLMWWAPNAAAVSSSSLRRSSDSARSAAGGREQVGQELHLQVLQPGVVEDLPHLARACSVSSCARCRRATARARRSRPGRPARSDRASRTGSTRVPRGPRPDPRRSSTAPAARRRPSPLLSAPGNQSEASAEVWDRPAIPRRPSCRSAPGCRRTRASSR